LDFNVEMLLAMSSPSSERVLRGVGASVIKRSGATWQQLAVAHSAPLSSILQHEHAEAVSGRIDTLIFTCRDLRSNTTAH